MKETHTVTFNTGRGYSEDGQLVTVKLEDNGSVMFHDHTRMIAGRVSYLFSRSSSRAKGRDLSFQLQHFVMGHYDKGEYTDCSKARHLQPVLPLRA